MLSKISGKSDNLYKLKTPFCSEGVQGGRGRGRGEGGGALGERGENVDSSSAELVTAKI